MEKMKKLLAVAFNAFEEENWLDAEQLYRKAVKEAKEFEEHYLNDALHMLAFTLAMKQEYPESRSIYEKLLGTATNDSDKAIILHQIGMVYRLERQYDKAIASFTKEKVLREKSLQNDSVGFSANAYEFGFIAMERAQLKLAFTYFSQALEHGMAADDLICIACAYRGLGTYYDKAEERNKAIQSFRSSISAFEETGDSIGARKVYDMLTAIQI